MNITAVLSKEDLHSVLAQWIPLELVLDGDGGERSFSIDEVLDLSFVEELGIRIGCRGRLRWPVLGMGFPVAVNAIRLLLQLTVAERRGADALVVRFTVEHADVAWVPSAIDSGITERINRELVDQQVELAWRFGDLLSANFKLPPSLRSAAEVDLQVDSRQLYVRKDALELTVGMSSKVTPRPPTV